MPLLTAYYLVWLLAGLALIALASAQLARRLRDQSVKCLCAAALIEALSPYAAWLAAQRGQFVIGVAREAAEEALRQAQALQARYFPQLASSLEGLLANDRRLKAWIRRQRFLRQHDPQSWLDMRADRRAQVLLRRQGDVLDHIMRHLSEVLRGPAGVDGPSPGQVKR